MPRQLMGWDIASLVPRGLPAMLVLLSALVLAGCPSSSSKNTTAATLTSIQVTPATATIAAGTTQQFTATGVNSDSTTQDLTSQVSWTSSATGTATVSAAGLATGVAAGGPVTITATLGTVSGTAQLTVTAAPLTSIQATPATATIAKGTTQQFKATGTFSDSSTQDLTSQVSWTTGASSDTGKATIISGGLATATGVGAVTVTATLGTVSGTAQLTVTAATLASIQVTPATPSIAKGTTQQFTATGKFSDSSTQDLTSQVSWTSSAVGTATVSASGLATGVAVGGPVTVTATFGTVSGTATLTVTAAVVTSIRVTPAAASIAPGATLQFTAMGTFSDTSTQDVTSQVSWTSSATGTATITSPGGLATGVATSVTLVTIKATSGTVSGTTQLTVMRLVGANANDTTISGPGTLYTVSYTTGSMTSLGWTPLGNNFASLAYDGSSGMVLASVEYLNSINTPIGSPTNNCSSISCIQSVNLNTGAVTIFTTSYVAHPLTMAVDPGTGTIYVYGDSYGTEGLYTADNTLSSTAYPTVPIAGPAATIAGLQSAGRATGSLLFDTTGNTLYAAVASAATAQLHTVDKTLGTDTLKGTFTLSGFPAGTPTFVYVLSMTRRPSDNAVFAVIDTDQSGSSAWYFAALDLSNPVAPVATKIATLSGKLDAITYVQ